MARYMHVTGVFEVPAFIDLDYFWDQLISDWATSRNYVFLGSIQEEDSTGIPIGDPRTNP